MQPEAVEYVIEPYRLYGPEFSFIQDLDCFLSEYDEGFLIPLQLGALQYVTHMQPQHVHATPDTSGRRLHACEALQLAAAALASLEFSS